MKTSPILLPSPSFSQMHLFINRYQGETKTLEECFGYMFSGGILPQEGEQIAMICTKRTDDELVIDLKVIKV